MELQDVPLWIVAGSLALNAIFLRQLLTKIDAVYTWICGTPEKPGIADRLRIVEVALDIDPIERRHRS